MDEAEKITRQYAQLWGTGVIPQAAASIRSYGEQCRRAGAEAMREAAISAARAAVSLTSDLYAERKIEQALRALPPATEAASPAAGWRPIDTAPKDGSEVMLWSRYQTNPVIGEWCKNRWWASVDGSRVIESQTDFGTDYLSVEVPSHWRPLPTPPAALEDE
jgi:hypothetical protein